MVEKVAEDTEKEENSTTTTKKKQDLKVTRDKK